MMPAGAGTLLRIAGARILYGNAVIAVRDVSMQLEAGSIVALLGANGAGKSTLLKAISGMLPTEGGQLAAGDIVFADRSLRGLRADAIVRLGIVQVPEGRRLFAKLTVRENLVMGGYTSSRGQLDAALGRVLALFPQLTPRLGDSAGYLSGGQQQMVAIGRALMSGPRLLMLDEPSLGLAPMIAAEIFQALTSLREQHGVSLLLIEQNARLALSVADHAYILENGRIMLEGPAEALARDPMVRSLYLGLTEAGARRSLRDTAPQRALARWPA